ncbi:hypothetical protein J2O02_18250 (plasmid) [Elizabethkingia anophelis]|uniref:hypothetical protein n=1 Tax=Elizabethkingia anophelis TaxID=1117645 RepID=UPI0020B86F06|nr:hypothetical protein [Elizabethkingia anophelis]UTG66808.1 hypothetical protein J2O02_18250 [Elizabethkingia anophelis]
MGNEFRLDGFNSTPSKDVRKVKKESFRMYYEDFEILLKFRNYKVIKEKIHDYNMSNAISDGLKLLSQKYPDIEKGKEKTKFRSGRRTYSDTNQEIKDTSCVLSFDDVDFISDFVYYKIYNEGLVDYSKIEFVHEIVTLIKEHYSGKF